MTIGRWILLNPGGFGKFLIAALALVAKLYIQVTGKEALWGPAAGTIIDMVVGGLTIYGIATGINHAARGPLLPPQEMVAATAVAAAQSQ